MENVLWQITGPVIVRARGTKFQYQSREMFKFLDNSSVSIRDTKLQSHKQGLPSLNKHKRAILAGEESCEASKVRRPCLTKNLKSLKDKASKNPSINSSRSKSNAAASVSAKMMKKPIKVINKVNCCSNPSLPTNSDDIDNNIEFDLINSEMCEQGLLELNLLPDGLLPDKLMTPVSTQEKSERVIAGGYYSFDGSPFNPIEEASLILNSPIAHEYSMDSCSNPSVLSDSAIVDVDFENNFLSSSLSELTDRHLGEKQIITPVSTPEKYERVTPRGFHSFDGSKFSPIEEAFLVLNSPIEDIFSTPVSRREESQRVTATGFHSFDGSKFSPIEEAFLVLNTPVEDLFISSVSTGVMSENGATEMLHIRDWNSDPTLPLQLSPAKCFDPWSQESESSSQNRKSDYEAECDLLSSGTSKQEKVRLDGTLKVQAELLEIKAQLKELGWLLESSLRRTDILLPKLARQNVLVAC